MPTSSPYACKEAWAYHEDAAISFDDIGFPLFGWTNGNFDLYACGSCDCPICSAGSPLCDRSGETLPRETLPSPDKCTCICPVSTPVNLELYGASSVSGAPEGNLLGTVSISFKDDAAHVVYTAAPGYVLNESNLYLGKTHLPFGEAGNTSNMPDLSDFPYQGTENETKSVDFNFVVDTYDFYIAAHARICSHFPTEVPSLSPSESPAPTTKPSVNITSPAPTLRPSMSASPTASVVPTAEPSICEDWQTITFEDFENYDWSWTGGNVTRHHEFSTYLGRLGEHMSTVSKQFRVPPDADHITIEFLFYEIDFWCSCDHITVEICDTQVDLGKFTPGDRGYVEGEVDGIIWSSNSLTGSNMMGFNGFNDQKHEMKMTIPRQCYSSGMLDLAFNLTTSDLASGGVDNLNITAFGLCGTAYDYPDIDTGVPMQSLEPSASPSALPSEEPTLEDDSSCTEARMVVYEDFEGFYDNSWVGGEVNEDYTLQFSHFLGRFGREQNRASKTFDVPQDAKSLTVEFLFYEIDNWEHRDRLLFIVGNTRLDLKQFGLKDPATNPDNVYAVTGKASGISWQRKTETSSTDLGFSQFAKDQKHKVSVSIPARYYAESGKLKLGFYLETSHDVWSESGGIDNFKITAHGTECGSSTRQGPSEDKEVCAHFWGDPHIVTFDGLKYDCQGEGEFVLLSSLDSSFEVQGRFESASESKRVAVTRSFAVHTGDEDVPSIQLSVPDEMAQGCSIELLVDGVAHDIYANGTDSDYVQVQLIGNEGAKRVTIYYPGSGLHLTSLLSESETYGCYLSSSICLPDDYRPKETFVGLLGSPNGDRKDDWMSPQGSPVSILGDKRFEAAYEYCTENWCIRNETASLFTYNSNKHFTDISKCNAPYNTAIEDAVNNAPDELVNMCSGEITCIIDGVAGNIVDAEKDLENEAALIGCTKLIFFDDFEGSSSNSWEGGHLDSLSDSLSTFLGPFGKGQGETSKELSVPAHANRLNLEFVFYQIGQWNSDSELVLYIGDAEVDLKEFDGTLTKLEGLSDGIFWSRKQLKTTGLLAYGSSGVAVHKVSLNIPNKHFSSGTLRVAISQTMVDGIETESGGVDSFRINAYFADCEDGQLGTATKPEVTVNSGASKTLWTDGILSCPDDTIWLECFGDPTTNAKHYPRTAHVRYEESYGGYICTQDVCQDCIGSITIDSVTKLEDGATLFDFSSDDFIFTAFGIEAGGGFSSSVLMPPLNEKLGIGNSAEVNSVSHAEFCLKQIGGQRQLSSLPSNELLAKRSSEASCYSAFAYFSQDKSTCFRDLGFDKADSGWSNGVFEASTIPYSFDLYADAEHCSPGRSRFLGSLSVEYDGHKANVSYEAAADMHLKETFTYVGKNFLPLSGSSETINPVDFPIAHLHGTLLAGEGTLTDSFEVAGFSKEEISVVAYATICEAEEKESAAVPVVAHATKAASAKADRNADLETCQSTFAYFNSEVSTCFEDMGYADKFGWSNGLLSPSEESYALSLYGKGSGPCVAGKMVGSVSVSHEGDEVDVIFETAEGFTLKETHTYVGKSWLPNLVEYSAYPLVNLQPMEKSDRIRASVMNYEPVVVVAHATVCGVFPPSSEESHGSVRGATKHEQQTWGALLGTSLGKLW